MSTTAHDLAEEAKLLRQSGHFQHSKELISLAKSQYPSDPLLEAEERKIHSQENQAFPRCKWALSWVVDRFGPLVVFVIATLLAMLLFPILFVPSL